MTQEPAHARRVDDVDAELLQSRRLGTADALAAGKTSGISKTDSVDPGRDQSITERIGNFRAD